MRNWALVDVIPPTKIHSDAGDEAKEALIVTNDAVNAAKADVSMMRIGTA
jgi:hypothetical protein